MNKMYCCSDLHGQYDLYEKINNWMDSTDTMIFLGDAIDRGPESYKLFQAIRRNPKWIFVKGNHEDMLETLLAHEVLKGKDEFPSDDYLWANYLVSINGGGRGDKGIFFDIKENYEVSDFLYYLNGLPLHYIYTNPQGVACYLSHSGSYWSGSSEEELKAESLLWDRNLPTRNYEENEICIHGHSPCDYALDHWKYALHLADYKDWDVTKGPLWLGREKHPSHRLDIDAGAFYTGYAYVIDLTSIEPGMVKSFIFSKDEKESEDVWAEKQQS